MTQRHSFFSQNPVWNIATWAVGKIGMIPEKYGLDSHFVPGLTAE